MRSSYECRQQSSVYLTYLDTFGGPAATKTLLLTRSGCLDKAKVQRIQQNAGRIIVATCLKLTVHHSRYIGGASHCAILSLHPQVSTHSFATKNAPISSEFHDSDST